CGGGIGTYEFRVMSPTKVSRLQPSFADPTGVGRAVGMTHVEPEKASLSTWLCGLPLRQNAAESPAQPHPDGDRLNNEIQFNRRFLTGAIQFKNIVISGGGRGCMRHGQRCLE